LNFSGRCGVGSETSPENLQKRLYVCAVGLTF